MLSWCWMFFCFYPDGPGSFLLVFWWSRRFSAAILMVPVLNSADTLVLDVYDGFPDPAILFWWSLGLGRSSWSCPCTNLCCASGVFRLLSMRPDFLNQIPGICGASPPKFVCDAASSYVSEVCGAPEFVRHAEVSNCGSVRCSKIIQRSGHYCRQCTIGVLCALQNPHYFLSQILRAISANLTKNYT